MHRFHAKGSGSDRQRYDSLRVNWCLWSFARKHCFVSWTLISLTCGFNKFIFGASDLRTKQVVSMSSLLRSDIIRSSTKCSGIFHQIQFQMKYELLGLLAGSDSFRPFLYVCVKYCRKPSGCFFIVIRMLPNISSLFRIHFRREVLVLAVGRFDCMQHQPAGKSSVCAKSVV